MGKKTLFLLLASLGVNVWLFILVLNENKNNESLYFEAMNYMWFLMERADPEVLEEFQDKALMDSEFYRIVNRKDPLE